MRAYVKRLRRKLGDDARDPVYILNHRGVGYSMPKPDDARDPVYILNHRGVGYSMPKPDER